MFLWQLPLENCTRVLRNNFRLTRELTPLTLPLTAVLECVILLHVEHLAQQWWLNFESECLPPATEGVGPVYPRRWWGGGSFGPTGQHTAVGEGGGYFAQHRTAAVRPQPIQNKNLYCFGSVEAATVWLNGQQFWVKFCNFNYRIVYTELYFMKNCLK